MKKLSTETLTLQIGPAESPLASFLLVLSFYGENLGGRGFVTVLPTIALQAPLDRARGELPSDTGTLISHREKFHGKIDEIWRSVIATIILSHIIIRRQTEYFNPLNREVQRGLDLGKFVQAALLLDSILLADLTGALA